MIVTHKDCLFGALFGKLKDFFRYLMNMLSICGIRRHVLSNSKIIGFICQHYHIEQIIRGKLINVNGKEKVRRNVLISHFYDLQSTFPFNRLSGTTNSLCRKTYCALFFWFVFLFLICSCTNSRYDRTKKYEIEKKGR